VCGPDGERLAKRHGAISLRDQLALGHTPAAVLGLLAASAGLAERGEEPTAAQVLERFDPDALRVGTRLADWPTNG
jgi:glutamyl-tRNA synthetase